MYLKGNCGITLGLSIVCPHGFDVDHLQIAAHKKEYDVL